MDAARGIPEIGIDIVRVARIAGVLQRHPQRFEERVLTISERAYVRSRPESMAGRWAAKEAVSKVLGLGVRGVGWREIEIERLPTGQPAVLLHDRAAARAAQLGISGVALSISHEREFAVAVAYAVRTKGGRFVYPPGVAERLGLSPDSGGSSAINGNSAIDGSSAIDGGAASVPIAASSEVER